MAKADPAPVLRTLQPGQFEVEGAVTTPFIARLRAAGLTALRTSAADNRVELGVDLGKISRIDSAGLALLIDWLAFVQQSGRKLKYSGGPASLRALARVSDVENLIYTS